MIEIRENGRSTGFGAAAGMVARGTASLALSALLVVAAGAVGLSPLPAQADQVAAVAGHATVPSPARSWAPAPWDAQDPADSLYRAAREAMNRGDYDQAAESFHRIWQRYPGSEYAPDAPYWEAFNRYRAGDSDDLQQALEVLALQEERYPRAPTVENGDAAALVARVTGLLARRGNQRAAQSVVVAANEIAGMSQSIGREVAAQMAVVAKELEAQGEIIGHTAAIAVEQAMAGLEAAGMGLGRRSEIPEECREQVETQLAALNALVHMNADRAMPVLEKVMARRDECSTPIRRRAVFMIADKRSPRSIDLLLRAAQEDPDLEVRRQAVFWLSEVDDPRAVDALERFIETSDDAKVRERAVFALSQHRSPQARQLLRRVARDRDTEPQVRRMAIFWIGNEATAEDLEFLKEMFGATGDPELDERILFAVGQAERADAAGWLLDVAARRSTSPELRKMAVFWAAEAGAPADALGRLYDRTDDREIRERILFGLSQSPQPAAIDKLIEIARTEADPELRKRAVFWLGNSNDPRAADVLVELLTNPDGG